MYAALIVDIVDSRKLSRTDREAMQRIVKACMEALNEIFRPSMAFEMVFSAGDEMQALFRAPHDALMHFRLMQMLLHPLGLRCGIGVGEWEVRLPEGSSTEQDGSAYHRARDAIRLAHRPNSCSAVLLSGRPDEDVTVNALMQASWLLARAQSRQQRRVQLAVERWAPLYDASGMEADAFDRIDELLRMQEEMPFFSRQGDFHDMTGHTDEESSPEGFVPVPISSAARTGDASSPLPPQTMPKKIAVRIAQQLGTSRQNIDNVMRKGNVSAIRSLDMTVLCLLKRERIANHRLKKIVGRAARIRRN